MKGLTLPKRASLSLRKDDVITKVFPEHLGTAGGACVAEMTWTEMESPVLSSTLGRLTSSPLHSRVANSLDGGITCFNAQSGGDMAETWGWSVSPGVRHFAKLTTLNVDQKTCPYLPRVFTVVLDNVLQGTHIV